MDPISALFIDATTFAFISGAVAVGILASRVLACVLLWIWTEIIRGKVEPVEWDAGKDHRL